jgi:hypothetical protein
MLCSTDTQFPIHLWDRLIPQAVITLNLLRHSRLNPKLSAHAQLNGLFDYNKTPLASPGTKVIIHKKTDHRGSWSPHGLNGWYIGPAMEHYQATIPALDLTSALQNPAPIAPFKQPGTNRMQEIKKLAAIFKSMAPKRTPVDELTEPIPKISTQPIPKISTQPTPRVPTPRVPTPRVPTPRAQESVTPANNPGHTHVHARRIPRGHQPPQFTQEERACQLIATPLPIINRAYAVTDVATGQQLKYRQLLQQPDLKPIWERAFEKRDGTISTGRARY